MHIAHWFRHFADAGNPKMASLFCTNLYLNVYAEPFKIILSKIFAVLSDIVGGWQLLFRRACNEAVQFISARGRLTLCLSEKFYECHTPHIKPIENSLPGVSRFTSTSWNDAVAKPAYALPDKTISLSSTITTQKHSTTHVELSPKVFGYIIESN